jgi:hypothetical protein
MIESQVIPYPEISAIPAIGMADLLHDYYKNKLMTSFNKLITYAAETLNVDPSSVLGHLQEMMNKPPRFLTPWSYHIYFKLRVGIMNDEGDSVKEILNELNEKPINCFQQSERILQPAFNENWEYKAFNDEVSASFGEHDYHPLPPCSRQFAAFPSHFEHAVNLIKAVDEAMADEINVLTASIKLLNNNTTLAATSPKFFGSIYLSMPEDLKQHQELCLVDHLVHETSHLFLNTVLAHDTLVLNDENSRYSSPIRKDPRPMLGIYHAVFVLSRVIRILKKIKECNLYHDIVFLNQCIKRFIRMYESGVEIINQDAILTDLGKNIFESTRECSLI